MKKNTRIVIWIGILIGLMLLICGSAAAEGAHPVSPDFATVQELDRLGNKIGRRDGTALVQDGIVTQTQEPTLGQHGKWTLSEPVAPQGTLLTMRTVSIQSVDPNGGYSTEYLIDDGKHSDIIGNTVESCDFVAPGNYRIVVYYFYSDGTCYMGYQEFTVSLDATHTAEDYPTVAEKVSRIVTQCKVAGDDWQTSLNLHDWLTSHAYYDLSYSFYGAEDVLLRGTGVCDSYSKAYCYLLGAAGITVQRVHSDTHAWNVITLGNTEYHVDVTWDDPVMADQNGQTINETVSGGEQYVYFCINDELIYGFLDENAEHGTGKTYTGATSLAESYLIHTDKWVDGGLYWDDEKQNIGVYRDLIVDSIPNTADGEFTVPADQECVISISDEGRISACAGNEQYAKWARYFYAYKLNETGITGLNEFKVAYDPENMVFRATVGEGMILIDGTGKILANGDALSGKIQYQIRVANLPEGCDELQFTWDDQNLDATAPMAWQDDWREPEHRDGKNYIFIMPELIGTYNSEVMFVRTGENDQNHRYIKLNYNRAPQDNGSINITNAAPPVYGENDYTLTWTEAENADFCVVIWEKPDGNWEMFFSNNGSLRLEDVPEGIQLLDQIGNYQATVFAIKDDCIWRKSQTWSFAVDLSAPQLLLDRDNEANVSWNAQGGFVELPLHQMANFYLYAPGADGAKIYYAGSKDEQLTEGNHFEDVWPGEDRGGSFGWFFSEVPDSFDPEAGHTFIQYIVAVVNYDDFNPEKTKTIYLPVHVVVDQSISSDVQFANPPYPYTGNQLDTSGCPIIARDEIFYVDVINNAEVDFYGAYITADGTASGTWIADSHWIPKSEGNTTRIPLTVPRCKADDTADGGENTGLYQVYVYAIKIGAPQKNAATTQKIHVVEQKYPDCPVTVSMKDTYTVGEPLRVFAHYSNPNNYQFGWMEVVIYETADPDNVIWAQSGDFNDFWETDAVCHSGGTYSVDVEIWRNVNGENQQVGLYRNIKTFRVISAGAVAEPQVNRVTTLNAGTNLVLTISTTEELATGESSGKAAADSFRAELIRVDHDWEWVDEREVKATATEPTDAGAQVTTATMTFDADEEYFEAGGHYLVWIAADKDGYDSSETEFQFVLTAVPDSAGQLTLKVDENAAAEQEVLSSTMLHVQVEVDPENRPTAIRILNGDEWEYWWGEGNSFETEWSYGDGEKLIYAEATWDDRYDFDELEEHDWRHPNGREFDWNNDVQWTAKSNAILLRIGSPYGDMRKANATLDNEALAGGGAIKIGEDLILNISDTSITDTNGKPISNAWYACHIYLKQQNQYGSYWERVWENVQQLHSGVNLIPTYTLEENNIYQIEIGTDAPGYKGASTYLQFRTGTRQHDEQTTPVKRFTVSGINEENEAPVNRELGLIAYQSGAEWYYIEIAKAGDEYWNEYRDGNGRVLNDSWAAYEPGTYTLTAYAFGKIRDDEGHETTDESGNDTWREKIGEVTVTATAAENPLAEVTLTVNGSSRASVPVDENDSHTLNIAISGVDYATNYHVRLNEYGDNECIFDRDYAVTAGYGATFQIADRRIQPGKAYEITCDTWAVGYVGSRTTLVFLLTGENSPSVSLAVEEKDEYWTAEDIQVMASAKGHDPAVTAIKICTGDETRYIRGDETGDEEYFNLKDTDTLIYAFATTDPYDVDAEDIDWESLDWSLQATPIRIHANTYGYTHAPSFYVPGEVAEGDWLEITINEDGNARQMDVRIVDKDGNDHEYRRFGEPGTYLLCTNELEAGRTYEVIMNCIQTRYLWSETKRTVRVVEKDHAPEAFFNVDKTTVCVDEPFTPWVYAKDAMAVCIAGDEWKPPAETGGEWDIETWSDGTWGAWFGDAGTNNADWEWCFDVPGTYQLNAWARYETEDHTYETVLIGTVTMTVTGRKLLDPAKIIVNQGELENVDSIDATQDFTVQIKTGMPADRFRLEIHTDEMDEPVSFEQTAGGAEDGVLTFTIPANTVRPNQSCWIDCYIDSRCNWYEGSESSKNIRTTNGSAPDGNLVVFVGDEWGRDEEGTIQIPVFATFDVTISLTGPDGQRPAAVAVILGNRKEYYFFDQDRDQMTVILSENQTWPETLCVQGYYGEPFAEGTVWEDVDWEHLAWSTPTAAIGLRFFTENLDSAEILVTQGEANQVNAVDATEPFEVWIPLVENGYEYILQIHQTDMRNKQVYRFRLTEENADEDGILVYRIPGNLLEANQSYWIDCYVSSKDTMEFSSSSKNIMTTDGAAANDTVTVTLDEKWANGNGYEVPTHTAFEVTVSLNETPDPRPTGVAVYLGDHCEYRTFGTDDSVKLLMYEGQACPEILFAKVCYGQIPEGDTLPWDTFEWSNPTVPVAVNFVGRQLLPAAIQIHQGENHDISVVDPAQAFSIQIPMEEEWCEYRVRLLRGDELLDNLQWHAGKEQAVNGVVTFNIEANTLEPDQTYHIHCLTDADNEEHWSCVSSDSTKYFMTTGGESDTTITLSVENNEILINQDFNVSVSVNISEGQPVPTGIALHLGDEVEYRPWSGSTMQIRMREYRPMKELIYAQATYDSLNGNEWRWEDLRWGAPSAPIEMTFTSNGDAGQASIEYPAVVMAGRDILVHVTIDKATANEAHANLDRDLSPKGHERLVFGNDWISMDPETEIITLPTNSIEPGTYLLEVDSSGVGHGNKRTTGLIRIVENPEWSDSKLILPGALLEIEEEAFEGVSADTVVIPNGVTTIGSRAFAGSNVRMIVIPASVSTIANDAFEGCELEVVYGYGENAEGIAREFDALYCDMR